MRSAGLEEAQAGIKIARRNINNLRYADDTTLMAESEEELKSLLMKVKEESENFGLKLNIQKTKIVASGPITSWEIDGETVETVSHFILGGSKVTADGDCSHETKRPLLLGRKVMTNLSSVQLLSRVLLFATPLIAAHQASLSITNSQNSLTHVHQVSDATQPSHALSSPSPPAPSPSQHQSLFQSVNSSHEVAKVLELQL